MSAGCRVQRGPQEIFPSVLQHAGSFSLGTHSSEFYENVFVSPFKQKGEREHREGKSGELRKQCADAINSLCKVQGEVEDQK